MKNMTKTRKYHSHGYAKVSHLISKKHTDKRAKKSHDSELKVWAKLQKPMKKDKKIVKVLKKNIKVAKKGLAKSAKCAKEIVKKTSIKVPIDNDGYIFIDLTKVNYGLRVKSIKTEGNRQKTIGIQFEKN